MLELAGMKLYDVQDLAELLDLHDKTVRKLLQSGTIKGKKLGKKWYATEQSLQAYFQEDREI